jgi:hypothetical protein
MEWIFLRLRYDVYTSADALSWVRAVSWLFRKDAIKSANHIACECPHVFVQVNDQWRKGKMVHFIRADLNAVRQQIEMRRRK